jgi:hypothetical protein
VSVTVEEIQPLMGPRARAAFKLPIEGQKRRKLLVLIAAYADAGECSPGWRQLGPRLAFLGWQDPPTRKIATRFTQLFDALEREGWLEITQPTGQERAERKRAVYRLLFDENGRKT